MKRILSVIAMVLVLVLAMGALSSCDLLNQLLGQGQPAEDTVTVSWYQGGKLLKEEEVAKGSKVVSWNPPAVEGKDFSGWYAEASLTQEFDFDAAINS